jgi:P4 family phage/plasmid primase-like protien
MPNYTSEATHDPVPDRRSNGRHTHPDPVCVDRAAISQYANIVIAGLGGFVPVRLLAEKGDSQKPQLKWFVADQTFGEKLAAEAERAAKHRRATYAIPGVVAQSGQAKAHQVVAMQTICADLDTGDIAAKLRHLKNYVGEPSMVVASGGLTDEKQEKVHAYWKLNEPAVDADVKRVCGLRDEIIRRVGTDPSFQSAHQPIRVAGSLYRKGGTRKLVEIREINHREYDLAELAKRIEAMPTLPYAQRGDPEPTGTTKRSRGKKGSAKKLLGRKIRENGADGTTRFEALSIVMGYWIRRFRDGHNSREKAWKEVRDYNLACIVPPWSEDRLEKEFLALLSHDQQNNGGAEPPSSEAPAEAPTGSDEALALQFTEKHADELRYTAKWGKWHVFDGRQWREDETLAAYDRARKICREAASSAPQQREAASAKKRAAVVSLAREDRRLAATTEQWDRDIWVLNTPGGVIDLRTFEIRPQRPTDYLTKMTAVAPSGDCPRFKEFLKEITDGNTGLECFLQRAAGYYLTGDISEEALFFAHGGGANGKGTFLSAITGILADYHRAAPIATFTESNFEQHPTELAMLKGSRLVTASETQQGKRWDESRIKMLTGGDPIPARFMRQDFFEYFPQFKLFIAGNHKPRLRSVDVAIRRRLRLLPFTVTVPEHKRDPQLKHKLRAEWPGILQWMLDGCADWQERGLAPPEAVTEATNAYLDAEDTLTDWIEECCFRNANVSDTLQRLFGSWTAWAEKSGERVGTKREFSDRLEEAHFERTRTNTARGFVGLKLLS